MASEYEQLRLKNIADNQRILAELGLLNPYKPLPRVIKKTVQSSAKRKREHSPPRKEKKYIVNLAGENDENINTENLGSQYGTRRRSSRVLGLEAPSAKIIEEEVETAEEKYKDERDRRRSLLHRPKVYGVIPGVPIGKWWETRMECNRDGIHRPTVAGIHPGPEGAYSIALSGGYEDDIDLGECFTYTGEGGRDLKGTANNPKNLRTAAQSKHQLLSKGNASLVKSQETGMPLRVIRGYKLQKHSTFAPEEGYRYDGLYKVEKQWYTTGMAGFGVYKFVLRRLKDQAPPPWTLVGSNSNMQEYENNNTELKDNNGGITFIRSDVEDHSPAEETAEKKESTAEKEETATENKTTSEAATANKKTEDDTNKVENQEETTEKEEKDGEQTQEKDGEQTQEKDGEQTQEKEEKMKEEGTEKKEDTVEKELTEADKEMSKTSKQEEESDKSDNAAEKEETEVEECTESPEKEAIESDESKEYPEMETDEKSEKKADTEAQKDEDVKTETSVPKKVKKPRRSSSTKPDQKKTRRSSSSKPDEEAGFTAIKSPPADKKKQTSIQSFFSPPKK